MEAIYDLNRVYDVNEIIDIFTSGRGGYENALPEFRMLFRMNYTSGVFQ